MKKLSIIIALILIASVAHAAEPKNYCHDKEAWDQWNDIVSKNVMNDDVQILHAMRIGLCLKVDQGSIELERAIDLFEQFRKVVLERNKPDDGEELDPQS